MLTRLSQDQCLAAMASGEFAAEIRGAAPSVAVILTQSWCSQWAWMRGYLDKLADDPSRAFFYVEYDREPWFEEFMAWKEDSLGNRLVPYVRYYRDSALVRESNFIDQAGFLRALGG